MRIIVGARIVIASELDNIRWDRDTRQDIQRSSFSDVMFSPHHLKEPPVVASELIALEEGNLEAKAIPEVILRLHYDVMVLVRFERMKRCEGFQKWQNCHRQIRQHLHYRTRFVLSSHPSSMNPRAQELSLCASIAWETRFSYLASAFSCHGLSFRVAGQLERLLRHPPKQLCCVISSPFLKIHAYPHILRHCPRWTGLICIALSPFSFSPFASSLTNFNHNMFHTWRTLLGNHLWDQSM